MRRVEEEERDGYKDEDEKEEEEEEEEEKEGEWFSPQEQQILCSSNPSGKDRMVM